MTKQVINIGTDELAGDGESLRSAFSKINENFNDTYDKWGNIVIDGSTIGTTDDSDIQVQTHIIPTENAMYDLGSPSKQWRSLYVSTSTIYINNVPLSLDDNNNVIVDGTPISSTINYAQIPFAPKDIADLTDNQNLLNGGGGGSTGDFTFDGSEVTVPNGNSLSVYTNDSDGKLSTDLYMDPSYGQVYLKGRYPDSRSFYNSDWDTGEWVIQNGQGRVNLTAALNVTQFLDAASGSVENLRFTVNGQGPFNYSGGRSPNGDMYMPTGGILPPSNPTAVTEIVFTYLRVGNIEINHDEGYINIDGGTDLSISVNTKQNISVIAKQQIELNSDSYSQLQSGNNYIWVEKNDGANVEIEGKVWNFNSDGDLTLPAGGDIKNSSGDSILGNSVVERSVEFPLGESGDTRGTIALTPNGTTYICTADWADATTALQGTFTADTVEAYNVGQSSGSFNSAVLSIQANPALYNILRYGIWNEGQLTVNAGLAFGGAQNVVNTGYNDQAGTMSFLWLHREEDPNDITQGTSVTIVYTGSGSQPPIWKKLVDLTSEGFGNGTINWTNEGDLTIETLRPEGYDGDCDVNIYGADDVWIEAKGDEAEIKAFSDVRIASDGGNHQWTFTKAGSLQLPNLNNTGYQNGYGLNGPTLRLGGENDPNDQVIITGPVPDSNNANAQRLVIQGQRGFGDWNQPAAGEGGDVYIWGGTGGEGSSNGNYYGGSGGDIKIRGGQGQNNEGGYVKIEGGSAADFNGGSNTGGRVEISGGDATGGANGNGGDVRIRGGRKQNTGNNGEVYVSTGTNSEFEWRFDNGGALNLATNNNISTITSAGSVILNANTKGWSFDNTGVLTLPEGGDIRNSTGSSVLGAQGNPQALNTVKGWFQLQGNRPNDGDEVAFQTITTFGNYIYTAGLNYYAPNQWEEDSPVVQKINKNTGEVVWSKRIVAGRNAQFNFEIVSGVVNVVGLPNAGTGYKAGEQLLIPGYSLGGSQPQGNVYVQVDTVDQTGAITGYVVSQQPQIPGSDGTYNNVPVYNNNNNVQPYSIAYDLNGEQLILACRTWRGAWSQENSWGYAYVDIYCLDDLTGAVNQSYTLKDLNDIEPTSVAVSSTGQIAVAGQKYNEYRSFGTLNILAPGNGYFDILKSNLDPEHYPNSGLPGDEAYNFFVQGTGIAYQESVDNVNYYQNVPTTVREGSGAVFDLVNNGNGTYGFSTIATAGTNYRVGHKIKILGTSLGGATPANDAVITVDEIDGNGGIFSASITGTAPGVVGATFNGVTGTNFEVGSGAQLNINISPVTGLITSIGTGNFGNYHYVVGDVLTVAGTNFANGASPANDITVTVTDVYLSGGPNGYSAPSGTVPSDALRIQVDGIDFTAGGGSWTMRQTLGGEAFIWTPTWNKAIGSSNNDWFNSVTFSPDGNSIYAVGSGQYEVTYQQALVVKFEASTGNIAWSKYVNSYLTPASEGSAEAMNAITLTDGKLIVSIGGQNNAENQRQEHGLVCLGSDGSLQWAKTYQEPNDSFDNECQVSRDSTNNLYLVYRGYSGNGNDAWTIVKINSTNGNIIWSRAVSNGNNSMYFQYNWSKDYAVVNGTDIFIAGHTYIPNDNYYSALLVKFPTDGFKTFDATGWDNGQQFGDLRVYEPVVEDFTQTQVPPTFTPTVHSGAVTTATNEKAFAAIIDQYHPHTYLQYFTRDDLGYVQFGDGSKQSFATNIEPQVLGSYYQRLKLGANDSGKHFFFDTNCGWGRIVIPAYDEDDSLPVGFKITIVNCSGGNIYVEALQPTNNNYYSAEIWGAGRNIRTREWGIPDSGSGSMVTLMKVKDAQYTGGENYSAPRWIISGPDDIYDSW